MLLTTLLVQHPTAIVDVVRQTPLWVGGLAAGLMVLGLSATRERLVHFNRLVALPLSMTALALWGVQSAFSSTGHLAALLTLWAICAVAMLALAGRGAPAAGSRYDAAAHSFLLPGSWVPMALIAGVFLMKYGIGVQLAMEPSLAHQSPFAFTVTALYGLMSGLFMARTLRVLRLMRQPANAALAA